MSSAEWPYTVHGHFAVAVDARHLQGTHDTHNTRRHHSHSSRVLFLSPPPSPPPRLPTHTSTQVLALSTSHTYTLYTQELYFLFSNFTSNHVATPAGHVTAHTDSSRHSNVPRLYISKI
ncbi:hypothetical protein E2C01_077535 [Portunus trituberculatus]|uniref:Uncharacterized protein n=1 Tax=Portunus trituberculatus TaxID=210409 RepID=A0A5B7ILM5_PORTR|nr:hypothetical protein [Portunus trituberculatus]